jgi:hypothetical protein
VSGLLLLLRRPLDSLPQWAAVDSLPQLQMGVFVSQIFYAFIKFLVELLRFMEFECMH